MSTPLSAGEIRVAAEVHRELGPEYGDAVVDSFLAKVDKEIDARVDARLASTRTRPLPVKAKQDQRRSLLTGIAIGGGIVGISFNWVWAATANRPQPEGSAGKDAFIIWAVILIVYLGSWVAVLARKHHGRD